jgi:uncharacterized membrane protein YhfC
MNIVARVLNFSLMIAMPFGLAVYLARKFKTAWRLFGIGAATFILSQVFHIPFNHWVLNPLTGKLGLSLSSGGIQLAAIGILYGLSAGLFEETARYLGYRWWIRDARDWSSALMFGTGHGGIESILLGVLVLVGFVQAAAFKEIDLTTLFEPDRVQVVRAQIEAYWSVPWHLAILGAVERLGAIPVHLSATVLVLQSFRAKNRLWLGLAVGWHMLVDAAAVYAVQTWNPYITEGIVLIAGLISLGVVFALRAEDVPEEAPLPEMEKPEIGFQPKDPSEEQLEDSRYV